MALLRTLLLSVVSHNLALRQPLFGSFSPSALVPQHKRSIFGNDESELQTWPMQGATYNNTRYLPNSFIDSSIGFFDTLRQFNVVQLPSKLEGSRGMGVVDQQHFFHIAKTSLARERSWSPGSGPSLILKANRFTGELEKAVTLSDATETATADSRGPIFSYGDHLYLTSGSRNYVWKLDKSTLSLVWRMVLPEWYMVIPPLENPQMSQHKAYTRYYTTAPIVIPPRQAGELPIVVVSTASGYSYGPHEISAAGTFTRNLDRLVQWHRSNHFTFGILDGDAPTLAYQFEVSPVNLQDGDSIPDESFAANEVELQIWDRIEEGMVFDDGNRVSGTPKSTGTFVFPTSKEEVIEGMFDDRVLYDKGYLRFTHGEVFHLNRSYTLTDVTDGNGNPTADVELPGSSLHHLPIMKTIYKNTPYKLTNSEAWGLNYYGGGQYGEPAFDIDTGLVYCGTGNAYAVPLADQLAVRAENDPGGNVKLDAILDNYAQMQHNANLAYKSGNTARALELAKNSIAYWREVENRRKQIRFTRSQRYQRFFSGSIVALDAYTGQLKWAYPLLGHDQRDASFLQQPRNLLSLYVEFGPNSDVLGSAIVQHRGAKLLLANGKYAVGIYNLSSHEWGFHSSRPDDVNAKHGLSSMRAPEIRVDFLMKFGVACLGGLVAKGGMYYKIVTSFDHVNRPGMLPQLPLLEGSPLLSSNMEPSGTYIWAFETATGTLKWIRVIDASSRSLVEGEYQGRSLVGYGRNLIVGSHEGGFHVIDMKMGSTVAVVPTLSGTSGCAPFVNNMGYLVGGSSTWQAKPHWAWFLETFSPTGV